MPQNIKLTINLFGAFRPFGDALNVSVPTGSTAAFVKDIIKEQLGQEAALLVEDAVLADDRSILADDSPVTTQQLSILPPVCGG